VQIKKLRASNPGLICSFFGKNFPFSSQKSDLIGDIVI
jgi:hypothetical protein